ncbi:SMP-30/gluconolactonase/LRE family protein [Roseinatronobacter alkalisoli]|uniref:SMP-30/gluconolactonase/LRE family protein n=1 Tax=Roseinatronobacter alkalisoli TaxID=3028235 RepID=A0ABT5T485_9RHOB|nr:SMP-30/gluconolactonase/LRE family protein [Roseinatronobacter sp. HJB301]MDD7969927.1 SMP-30/gluconolactonase/LRE family protein [Roseinatronobacter sp. HJB301]
MKPLNETRCELGEGAFWHPERAEFFWFDIIGRKLHSLAHTWAFDEMVSAAGWLDASRLLVASEIRLFVLDLDTGAQHSLCPLEADQIGNRSNDGRADPQGGFWIGTMGKQAARGAGAIWRWWRGELRCLYPGLSIPNAICFAPDGRSACFTDTVTRRVMRVGLDASGWPKGTPECWLDLNADGLNPDGAVIDTDGNMWLAQWGAARVACYAPDGALLQTVAVPAAHASCPAFGGPDLRSLYCTTARQGLNQPGPLDGATFMAPAPARGQAEHRVLLDDGT